MIISIRGIHKSFPDGHETRSVLNDVNIDIRQGTLTALTGRSGCGKTTLLYILAGLLKPDAGTYYFQGNELPLNDRRAMRLFRLQNIGFVLQEDSLLYDRTVRSNILLGSRFSQHTRQQSLSELDLLSCQLHINHLLNADPRNLSGGEKQRVAIARGMIGGKTIVLADEPTGALDHQSAVQVMDCFAQMKDQGKTIILVTHDIAIAQRCDRIIHIEYGKTGSDSLLLEKG